MRPFQVLYSSKCLRTHHIGNFTAIIIFTIHSKTFSKGSVKIVIDKSRYVVNAKIFREINASESFFVF